MAMTTEEYWKRFVKGYNETLIYGKVQAEPESTTTAATSNRGKKNKNGKKRNNPSYEKVFNNPAKLNKKRGVYLKKIFGISLD